MDWDGVERRNDDHASRIASLEAYSKTQNVTIRDLKYDLTRIREATDEIRRDIHAAKMAGRFGLGIALALGGLVAWITQTILRS